MASARWARYCVTQAKEPNLAYDRRKDAAHSGLYRTKEAAMRVNGVLQGKGSDVATIGPDQTLLSAAAELGKRRIGALVVVGADGSVVGIVSERDIVAALARGGAAILERPVSEVMSVGVITCSPTDTMEQLMTAMTEQRIRHLPVLSEGALVGIVSIGDVVKRRVAEIQDEAKALGDYITQGR